MTDGFIQIVAALAFLYAVELVSYVAPPRRLLVQPLIGRRARVERAELVLRAPTTWGLSFAVEGFRLIFGSRGCYVYQPHRITTSRPASWGHRWVTWDSIKRVRAIGNELEVNGQLFLKHSSDAAAAQSREWLERVLAETGEKREREIERIMSEMVSLEAIHAEMENVRRDALVPRLFGTALFTHIAGTVVLFATTEWALPEWRRFLFAFVLLLAASVWQLVRGHRALYPELGGDRWLKAFITLVNYPSACRVAEQICRDRLNRFHALAATQVIAHPRHAHAEARRTLLELRFPSPLLAEEHRDEIEVTLAEHRPRADAALCEMLRASGVDIDELVKPPVRNDGSYGYCPRCHEEYVGQLETCDDCQVAVVPFEPA